MPPKAVIVSAAIDHSQSNAILENEETPHIVDVHLISEPGVLILIISDNGKGISPRMLTDLRSLSQNLQQKTHGIEANAV